MRTSDPKAHSRACEETGRRRFLSRLSVTLGAIGAALVAIPSIGFLLGLRKAPQVWRTVGKLNDFRLGSTVNVSFLDPSPLPWSGVTAQTAAWLRRVGDDRFIAFSMNCTHLGCPVRWLADAEPVHVPLPWRRLLCGRLAWLPDPRRNR